MQLVNAVAIARMAAMAAATKEVCVQSEGIAFGSFWWFIYAGISCFLVLFAGIMSGLTLGLMSLSLVDLEILQRSGSFTEKKQAGSFSRFRVTVLSSLEFDSILFRTVRLK